MATSTYIVRSTTVSAVNKSRARPRLVSGGTRTRSDGLAGKPARARSPAPACGSWLPRPGCRAWRAHPGSYASPRGFSLATRKMSSRNLAMANTEDPNVVDVVGQGANGEYILFIFESRPWGATRGSPLSCARRKGLTVRAARLSHERHDPIFSNRAWRVRKSPRFEEARRHRSGDDVTT